MTDEEDNWTVGKSIELLSGLGIVVQESSLGVVAHVSSEKWLGIAQKRASKLSAKCSK